jgi:hypothetical protein
VIAALVLMFLAPAQTAAAASAQLPPIMHVSDVQAGMKCTGRTVYTGTEIVDFQAEILGVLPGGWGPGEDVIIARLVGPNADRYGVVAGMSGSPVFCDGKMIGALSLSMGSFMREPIAGITPIDSMLRVQGSRGWPLPKNTKTKSAGAEWQPIASPLVLAGFAPESIPIAQKLLEPYGFVVSGGGGMSSGALASTAMKTTPDVNAAKGLQPGAAVAGVLVDGDVNMAATGTLTWRDGDSISAFGHSFLLYGDVEMPMATANIITTVPSDAYSYKMATPTAIVGAVTRDNRTAIAGTVGATASLIPVTVKLPEGTTHSEIHFRVFRNKILTAPMMTIGLMNGLLGNAAYDAEGTVRLEGRLAIEGYPDIALTRTYFDPGANGASIPGMAAEISATLQKLFDNDLAPASVKGVTLSFGVEKQHRETKIDSAWSVRNEVRAGETVGVRVRMRPWRGPSEVREVLVKIPDGTPAGPLTVDVADAKTFDTKDRIAPGLVKADDLGALIEQYNERRPEDTLYVRLTRTAAGAIVRGVPLAALPPDALSVVRGAGQSAGGADPLSDVPIDEVKMPLGARVVGSAEFTITVKN